ncbi:MAG: hypothetical protein ACM3ST_15975 [Bdellovibrio bacteriovorus]
MDPTRARQRTTAIVTAAIGLTLLTAGGESLAAATISCAELSDPDRVRVLLEVGAEIEWLQIVTPEFLWGAPGQPETRGFPAGKRDVSPNLVGREGVYVEALRDAPGALRAVDFGVSDPDALELEGLRGSLALHEPFLDDRAIGSLYYRAMGDLLSVVPLSCRRYPD